MAFSGDAEVAAFADAYQRLAQAVANAVPPKESPFAALLRDHLGRDTDDLSVVAMELDTFEHPNLQRAIDAYAASDDVVVDRVVGMRGQYRMYGGLTLSMLTMAQTNMEIGPVDYIERPVDVNATETCTDFGLFLMSVRGTPAAMLVRGADDRRMINVNVEVMAVDRDDAKAVLGDLRGLMSIHNVFRQKVISLTPSGPMGGSLAAKFIERPSVDRDAVILPDGVLEQVERLTVDFSARAASLKAGGRHLRRGVLLHGSPGTGKTHTVRYLTSRLTDRTVFVLSGSGLGVIGKAVGLARSLSPSIVVLEDVDLVAEERTRPHAGTNPVLFELLNQMDGVEDDVDIVFVLTTNRPDLLEPALASRPGRIDLAIEIPLPAASERQRLLQLYAEGLDVDIDDWTSIVDGTEGSSAAFLRELIRQAALDAAGTDGTPPTVGSQQLLAALASMSHADQAMTARLMGSAR